MSRPDPIPFDTHRFVKRLTKEGMPTGQAEALADEQVALLNSNLATKQDLANSATKQDLADFATKQDVAVLKSELLMVKWIVSGVGFGMLALVLGVLSLVIRTFWTA
jgi:hypothetical protein